MKASEFIIEDDSVSVVSGDIAPVSMPLGTIQRRMPLEPFSDKYPNRKKKRKSNARRRS